MSVVFLNFKVKCGFVLLNFEKWISLVISSETAGNC